MADEAISEPSFIRLIVKLHSAVGKGKVYWKRKSDCMDRTAGGVGNRVKDAAPKTFPKTAAGSGLKEERGPAGAEIQNPEAEFVSDFFHVRFFGRPRTGLKRGGEAWGRKNSQKRKKQEAGKNIFE